MSTLTETGCRLEDFVEVLAERTDPAHYPHATAIEQEVLVYDRDGLLAAPDEELVHALSAGPGVVLIKGAYADVSAVDATTAVFEELMTRQRVEGGGAGDHFAPFGVNERVWNALEKLAVTNPAVFVEYYANPVIAKIATAWLGPNYQVTSQVNVVNPGGKAQSGHRDYHLGFLHAETIARFPEHVQKLSPVLTLQGAVAHSDMPLESGPTMYLPHSQKYVPGYIAMNRPDFQEYFEQHHVQLPLATGGCRVLQPGGLPRRGHQPLGRLPPHRQPPADLLGVRAGDGERRPGPDLRGDLPGAAGAPGAGARRCGVGGGLRVPDQPRPRRGRRRPHPAQPGRPRPAGVGRGLGRREVREGPGRQQPAPRHPLSRVSTSTTASLRFRDGESRISPR